jgi:hypothetical protein
MLDNDIHCNKNPSPTILKRLNESKIQVFNRIFTDDFWILMKVSIFKINNANIIEYNQS